MKSKYGKYAKINICVVMITFPFATLILTSLAYGQQQIPDTSQTKTDKSIVFTVVEEQPCFPGGEKVRIEFLQQHVIYPPEAIKKGIQGKVYIRFIVETDGSLTGIQVLRGIGGGCDEAAVNAVKAMPKWIPGKEHGIPVRVQFNLPIKFTLNESSKPESSEFTDFLLFRYNKDSLRNFILRNRKEDVIMLDQCRLINNSYKAMYPDNADLTDRNSGKSQLSDNSYNKDGWIKNQALYSSENYFYGFPRDKSSKSSKDVREYLWKVEIIMQTALVLTQKGAEDYSKFSIPLDPMISIKEIFGSTIKPDGKVVKLKEEDIRRVSEYNMEFLKFSLPGVEPGDTVFFYYIATYDLEKQNYDEYFMNSGFPLFSSRIAIYFDDGIKMQPKYYNGLSKPVASAGKGNHSVIFHQFNIDDYVNRDYSNHDPGDSFNPFPNRHNPYGQSLFFQNIFLLHSQ